MAGNKSSTAYQSINQNAPKQRMSGVYQIRNTLNGKRYIGSTVCFKTRWRLHLFLLRTGKARSRHFQGAWNKYGENGFMFEILEIVIGSDSELRLREQFYLDTEQPEYNVSNRATGGGGLWPEDRKAKLRKPKSPETVKRMSEGTKRAYQDNPKLRQLRLDTFRKHRENNPDYNRGPNNGFYGKAPNREVLMSPEIQAKRTAALQRVYGEGRAKLRFRPVYQLTRDGELIRYWDSIIEAAKSVGVSQGHIGNICRGHDKTAGGFQWRYAGERKAACVDSCAVVFKAR